MNDKKICILGAGTFGIALARVFAEKNMNVVMWSAVESEIANLCKTRIHPNLPKMEIPSGIVFTEDLKTALSDAKYVLFAVSSVYVRQTAKKVSPLADKEQIILNVSKGIEKDTLLFMSDVLCEEIPDNDVVILSGPTHAEEVALDMPTTIISACKKPEIAKEIGELFEGTCIRAYTNTDVTGIELSAALKNVIALAAGISTGLGYGDNAKAAIITRGLAEIKRLGIKMNCIEQTFSGLAGIGDLIVTATSMHSRNNRCGMKIGEGIPPEEAEKSIGMVVEGINAIKPAMALAEKYKVYMPILYAVNDIVYNGVRPKTVVDALMNRNIKSEIDEIKV